MVDNLAILSGFGILSQEIDILARSLSSSYRRYTIEPWFQDPIRLFVENVQQRSLVTGLHPFKFSEIEKELREKNIEHIFLTGDFPKDRFVQARLAEMWPRFFRIADTTCANYFDATSIRLSNAARYFLTLERLLSDLKVRPLLAHEIFPALNVPYGWSSNRKLPQSFLDQIPELVARTLQELEKQSPNQNRFSQAVIVDRKIVFDTEANGTDDLLRRYAKSRPHRTMPFLLKLPSAGFNPALDQPTIGLRTIFECEKAGVQGVLICAETTIVAQKQAMIERINQLDMFLYAVPFNQLRKIYLQHSPNSWAKNASIGLPQH